MKNLRLYVGVVALVAVGMLGKSEEGAVEIREKILDKNLDLVFVVSHRAGWGNFPGNLFGA